MRERVFAFRIGKRWRTLRAPRADTLFLAGAISMGLAAVVLLIIIGIQLVAFGPQGYVQVHEHAQGNYRILIYNENYARWVVVSSSEYDACPVGTYYPTCARR